MLSYYYFEKFGDPVVSDLPFYGSGSDFSLWMITTKFQSTKAFCADFMENCKIQGMEKEIKLKEISSLMNIKTGVLQW